MLPLALIFAVSTVLCSICKKLHIPFVIGELLAGILIGLVRFIPNQLIITDFTQGGLAFFAKIGVILIMFSAGLGTDIKVVRTTGGAAIVITLFGVVVPIGFGFLTAFLFLHEGSALTSEQAITYFYYGVILTATSVSVTVSTLKELNKLNTRAGTAIVTAAILDDIVGVILLSLAGSLSGADVNVGLVILKTIAFFVVAIPLGFLIRFAFKKLIQRGISDGFLKILGISVAFVYAYCAEELCGVADITGAFFAGLMLSGTEGGKREDSFVSTLDLFFLPVFFANIGITMEFATVDKAMLLFGVCYVIAALLSKVIGCGGGALLCRFSPSESLGIGVGMMVRAEVLLICAEKGIRSGLVSQGIMPFIIVIILASSLVTPLILKLMLYRRNAPLAVVDLPPSMSTAPQGPTGTINDTKQS